MINIPAYYNSRQSLWFENIFMTKVSYSDWHATHKVNKLLDQNMEQGCHLRGFPCPKIFST
jgi:hypothetical protein